MPEILITVRDKLPVIVGEVKAIVTDNSDYTVRFSFDEQWGDGTKTVYFIRSNGYAYEPVKTVDDTVSVPVQRDAGLMTRLLIGVQQGDVKTSRPCAVAVYPAVTDMIEDDAVQPDPSLWENFMKRLELLEKGGGGGNYGIDDTLTKEGYAADAKAVGDAIAKKLDSDKLGNAVDDALRQAKESGEFDGAPGKPGVTPHIGANGNWFVGDVDTGVQAQGKDGDDYVLTDADKNEIAEEAAKLVEVPGEESYRLLKTITLTEEVAQIYEVFETKYDGVMIVIENIILDSGTMALYVGGGNNSKRRVVGVSTIKNNQVLRYRLYKTHGMWESIAYYGNKSDVSTVTGQLGANVVTATSSNTPDGFTDAFEAINNIRVYSYADKMLPVGLTAKIFVLGGATNA